MSDTHAQTVGFVRRSMVPPAPPPVRETGAVKWMRENLFSGWLNILLTIGSLAFIAWALAHLLPWFVQSVWVADSLSECREIRNARYGEDAASACFAVITDRWNQLLFGFYPQELYWRPVLALVLFLAATAPVLFQSIPRVTLWGSAAYPFVGYWLLWGGTIWGPLAVAAGFGVGWLAYVALAPRAGALGRAARLRGAAGRLRARPVLRGRWTPDGARARAGTRRPRGQRRQRRHPDAAPLGRHRPVADHYRRRAGAPLPDQPGRHDPCGTARARVGRRAAGSGGRPVRHQRRPVRHRRQHHHPAAPRQVDLRDPAGPATDPRDVDRPVGDGDAHVRAHSCRYSVRCSV